MEKTQKKIGGNSELEYGSKSATFVVKVIYSKNTSVQGHLHWLESEKSVPFRSYMEMTSLINEALFYNDVLRFRSWHNDSKYMGNGEGK